MTGDSRGFSTRAIHAGQEADPATGATVVPIYATSTFTQEAPGRHKGYEYSRSGNPTRTALETCLAALEGGERAWPSPRAWRRPTAVLSTLRPGDEVAAAADLYGGTFRLLERVFKPWGLVPRYTEDASSRGLRRDPHARPPSSSGSRRRPTRCSRSSTSPRSPSWRTGRGAAGGGQHVRLALSPAADRARCRPGGPQHDQVPRRPFRRDRRGGDRPPRPDSSRSPSTRTPPAASPARSMPG